MTVIFTSLGRSPSRMPPYPSWEAWIIETIEEALRHSSLHVEADMGGKQAVLDANEEHITRALQRRLAGLLEDGVTIPRFSADIFQTPTRNESCEDYTGKHIDKQPDLVFKLVGQAQLNNCLFCEGKILDKKHSIRNYIYQGMIRFVRGQYAWAMPYAHMIAYVRETSSPQNLVKYLAQKNKRENKTHAEIMSISDIQTFHHVDLI
jgi:hypothetical protein